MQQRRAIISVPVEWNEPDCPKTIREIGNRQLRAALTESAKKWIEIKALEGEWYVDAKDIHVYGPYPSAERLADMLSCEDMSIGEIEREQIVLERGSFSHYLLNAEFIGRGIPLLTKGVTDGISKSDGQDQDQLHASLLHR